MYLKVIPKKLQYSPFQHLEPQYHPSLEQNQTTLKILIDFNRFCSILIESINLNL